MLKSKKNSKPSLAFQAERDGNSQVAELFRMSSQKIGVQGATLQLQSVLERIERTEYETSIYQVSPDIVDSLEDSDYYVCTVCGYLREEKPLEHCPLCNAGPSAYHKVT